MVVDQIHIARVACLEAEDDTPVYPDSHAPATFEVALETVQSEARQVHVLGPSGAIQHDQDVFQFLEQLQADTLGFAVLKQLFQPFVFKAFDYSSPYHEQ